MGLSADITGATRKANRIKKHLKLTGELATRKEARELQKRLKSVAPVDTGFMRSTIKAYKEEDSIWRVGIPKWKYMGFFYPVLFMKLWRRTVEKFHLDAQKDMTALLKRAIKDVQRRRG
jgi:hypothetical protein